MLSGILPNGRYSAAWPYAIAIAATLGALWARWELEPFLGQTYIILLLAVTVAALTGGRGPGLLATAVSILLNWRLLADPVQMAALTVFSVVALAICFMGGRMHQALGSARAQIAHRLLVEEKMRESETLLRAVSESSADCMFLKDRRSRFLFANPATLRLMGKTADEALGKTEADCFRDAVQGRAIVEADLRAMEHGEQRLVEETIEGANGTRTFMTLKTPWRDPDGRVVGLAGVARDITDLKKSQEELKTKAGLVNLSHDAIITADGKRHITGWNQGAAEMYGFTAKEAIGHLIHEFLQTDSPVSVMEMDESLRRNGRWEGELVHTRAEGWQVIVESRQVLMRDASGAPAGILEINRDITERKTAEQALAENRTHLRLALEAAQLGTWELDLASGSVTASRQTQAMFGFEERHWDLAEWLDRIHAGDRDRVGAALRAAIDGLANYDVEYRITPGGRTVWVAGRGVVVSHPNGRPATMISVVQDITQRKLAEELLRERETLFRSIAEGIPAIVWTADENGALEYLNSNGRQYTGVGADWSPEGHPSIWDRLDIADMGRTMQAWRTSLATRQPFHVEARLLNSSKESRWFQWHAVATGKQGSTLVRWFGTAVDIHDRKAAERELRELNTTLEQRVHSRTAQLQAANKELEAFAYSVSHDLRAPLRGIDGWSLALLEDYGGSLDENARQYLGRVRSETQRMGELIDDLLKLSRITRVQMNVEPVDFSGLAESIAARLREAEPGRDIDFAIAPGLTVNGDRMLLDVALTNLLTNAAKFTSRQSMALIEVGRTGENGNSVYYVRDNGVGFDMAYSSLLFGAFQRLHKQSEFPGTGVGLATVQRVIRRHGGNIWAEAKPDAGATFYFTL